MTKIKLTHLKLNDSMKSIVQNFMKNKITDFRLSKGTGMQTETDARPQDLKVDAS